MLTAHQQEITTITKSLSTLDHLDDEYNRRALLWSIVLQEYHVTCGLSRLHSHVEHPSVEELLGILIWGDNNCTEVLEKVRVNIQKYVLHYIGL